MIVAGHLAGGAPLLRKYKIAASFADAGVPTRHAGTNNIGLSPCTTTSFADTVGLAVDTATYSATQGVGEGLVTVSVRPDCVVKAIMSGGATAGTALTKLVNTAAETAGTVVTDADVGSADMTGGIIWCIAGANVGQSRMVTTHTASTSMTVTVPFLNDIALNDEFLFAPWAMFGDGNSGLDGHGHVQTTATFIQANAAIASGTGGAAMIVDLELNGQYDSAVLFLLADHILNVVTT